MTNKSKLGCEVACYVTDTPARNWTAEIRLFELSDMDDGRGLVAYHSDEVEAVVYKIAGTSTNLEKGEGTLGFYPFANWELDTRWNSITSARSAIKAGRLCLKMEARHEKIMSQFGYGVTGDVVGRLAKAIQAVKPHSMRIHSSYGVKSGVDSNNHWILAKHFNAGDIRKELETLLDVVRVALPHCFNEAGKEVIRA